MAAVIHIPRLAWDGARTLVEAAQSDVAFPAVAQRVAALLPGCWQPYVNTRNRILRPDRDDVVCLEAGVWRVRLEELLREFPQLADPVRELTAEAAALVCLG
jgi:hypothetical protein